LSKPTADNTVSRVIMSFAMRDFAPKDGASFAFGTTTFWEIELVCSK
jgi:hypothetical protein